MKKSGFTKKSVAKKCRLCLNMIMVVLIHVIFSGEMCQKF